MVLRPVDEADAPLIHRWMNHPEVWHYMDYEQPFSMAEVMKDIERSRREGFPYTIEVDGRPIGRIGLNRFRRRDRICSFYMYVGEPAFWSMGHAGDAITTLLAYAFDRWDLHQVELLALGDNDRAIQTYERHGFVLEARLRERSFKDGGWVDHVLMSVQREEFDQARRDREQRHRPAGPEDARPASPL